jgi:excinuclease UvrABC nuclease subunit
MPEPELLDSPKVQQAIDDYCRKYAIQPSFPLSEPYHLAREWKAKTIPHADRCGCYFFYDEEGHLLYIGKVSLSHTLGRRTTHYFRWDAEASVPVPKDSGWTAPPAWLQTLCVNEPYEAPSLEEYLIHRLRPPSNTRMGRG